MATQVRMEGVDALVKKLDAISYDMSKRGGRFALRKAAQIVRDAARQNAMRLDDPESASQIYKNITERWASKINKRTGDLAFRVGVMGGAGISKTRPKGTQSSGPGGDTRHWFYLEFGKENMAAQPFMRPALEQNAQRVTNVFISEYSKAIDRALKKAGK